MKSDQEFEADIADFAKQLERNCVQQLANHARKLRPNYEEQWILKLKLRLQTLENSKQHGSGGPASAKTSSSSMKAPSGQGRKH